MAIWILSCYQTKDNYYELYTLHLQNDKHNDIENDEEKILNKAIKYKYIVVIGDEQFHKTIDEMKLASKYIYYLKEKK